jgi:hypothetical protein
MICAAAEYQQFSTPPAVFHMLQHLLSLRLAVSFQEILSQCVKLVDRPTT